MIHGKFVIQDGLPRTFEQEKIWVDGQNLVHTKEAIKARLKVEFPTDIPIPDNSCTHVDLPDALGSRWASHPASPSQLSNLETDEGK